MAGQKLQRSLWCILICLFMLAGCKTSKLRNQELQRVAKDWALVIRASQIIPVYPLSEDLQPGDVMLVSTPIEEQVELYNKKGFLPLDQHLARLYSRDYAEFYQNRYGVSDLNTPPTHWQQSAAVDQHNWTSAPHAAFPTYQFSVRTGSGLNLAIPLEGVPLALGLMNSGRASGTVTIADAYTYGMDTWHLEKLVRAWASNCRRLLSGYEPHKDRHHFLRIISRVYVTGRVSVTINNDEATSAEAAGGADRPVQLLGVKASDTEGNYTAAMASLNKLIADQLPGGRVKIATASSRSISLSEAFERPLVVGYVGFDMPILKGGRLGPPISTLAQLADYTSLPTQMNGGLVYRLASLSHMHMALRKIRGDEADRIREDLDSLDRFLPARYPFSLYEFTSPESAPNQDPKIRSGMPISESGFKAALNYLGNAEATCETLGRFLKTAPQETEEQQQTIATLKNELRLAETAIQELDDKISSTPVLQDAIYFVFFGNG